MTGRRILALLLIMMGAAQALAQQNPTPTPTATVNGSAGCGQTDWTAGVTEQTLMVDGQARRYLLYVPAAYTGRDPLPLLLSYHGFASSAQQQMDWTDFNPLAETYGFVAVYPQGSGFPARWFNGLSNFIAEDDRRDVVFTGELLTALAESLCLDMGRVYATGFSAGGGMAHRLACELADRITAIGTVAGAYSAIPGGCLPARPVPVISFHGDADPITPYTGDNNLPAIGTWAGEWAARNGCDAIPEQFPPRDGAQGEIYRNCDAEVSVRLYTVVGGGHTWPGQAEVPPAFLVGALNQELAASDLLWRFFAPFRLAPAD